jgi:hypothetical protein
MRGVRLVAWLVGLSLLIGGCSNPLAERRFINEGAGVDLYTSDRAGQVELLSEYERFICAQLGPSCGDWGTFVLAGMNDIDQRCDGFLTWLDARRRDREPVLAELSAINTAVHSVMTVTGSSPKSLDIVTAAFGLASASYANWNSRLLISANQSTVQEVVYKGQGDYREKIRNYSVPDQPTAIYLLRNYLRLCMPTTIEASINTTTTLVLRDAPNAARKNLIVSTVGPRVSPLREATRPLPERTTKPVVISDSRLNNYERSLLPNEIIEFQQAACVTPATGDLGLLGSETRIAIKRVLNSPDELLTDRKGILLRKRLRDGVTC